MRSCPILRNLCCLVRGGVFWSFRLFGLLLLTGIRRILNLGFLSWLNNCRSHFLFVGRKAWGSYGWKEKDIFLSFQLRRSLNPSSVEGFFPSLRIVGWAYDGDLCPESILSLSYADVVAMLFGLVSFLFGLGLQLLCLSFCFLGLIFEPLGFTNCFLSVANCSLEVANWSLASRVSFLWFSACLCALSRATSAFF